MRFVKPRLFLIFILTIFVNLFSLAHGSEKFDFEEVTSCEDNLLSNASKIFFKKNGLNLNTKIYGFNLLERPEEQYGHQEKRFKIDITGMCSLARICLLEKIIKSASSKGITSTYFTVGEHHYKLYLNPTPTQEGNGVIVGLNKYSFNGSNGETYLNILKVLKSIPKDKIKFFQKALLTQKKDGLSIRRANLGYYNQYQPQHQVYARYLDGLNLLLDFEVARRRIDETDPHFKSPLLLATYFLLSNLGDDNLLTAYLGGNGGDFLFGGNDRREFISNVLSQQTLSFTPCDLSDFDLITRFLITIFTSKPSADNPPQPQMITNAKTKDGEEDVSDESSDDENDDIDESKKNSTILNEKTKGTTRSLSGGQLKLKEKRSKKSRNNKLRKIKTPKKKSTTSTKKTAQLKHQSSEEEKINLTKTASKSDDTSPEERSSDDISESDISSEEVVEPKVKGKSNLKGQSRGQPVSKAKRIGQSKDGKPKEVRLAKKSTAKTKKTSVSSEASTTPKNKKHGLKQAIQIQKKANHRV